MNWSAAQYSKFEAERNRPITDLLSQIKTLAVVSAVDLGCGPGNSTALLQERFPDARVIGIDSSAEMVTAARRRLPDVRFEIADIGTWRHAENFDLILANASLQWLPDHETLFPALTERLRPGGTLAAQMPDNLDEPAHVLMREIAIDGPWSEKLATAAKARAPRHGADWYCRLLRPLTAAMDIWRTIYYHPLAGGAGAVMEWFKGSGLRPFLEPLNEAERRDFLERYEAGIARAYPAFSDGTVLLPFPRLFIMATR